MTLLRQVEVAGELCDVRLREGRVAQVGALSASAGEQVLAGGGGALLPGLHDHHLHLFALAAAAGSVDVSGGLEVLRGAAGSGWLRAVGWAGEGDRRDLDAVVPGRPVRVQHRSGALWVLNSAAVDLLDLSGTDEPGVERDASGRPTGRVWRADAWLGRQVGREPPSLAAVGARLAALGVTGVTDATPGLDPEACALLRSGVPQRVHLLGDPAGRAPVKVVLGDSGLPDLDALVEVVRAARPRPVAVHCVSRAALVLLLAALQEVGGVEGDRVEHAALVPPDLLAGLPTVVTQPGFLAVRGDDYARDLDDDDLDDLYRYASLLRAGVGVVPSSDAPYGPLDPWQVLRAARDRTTASGRVLGERERVGVEVALDGMLRPLEDLGAPARTVAPGVVADLVLLSVPLAAALQEPSADLVRATWVGGRQVHPG